MSWTADDKNKQHGGESTVHVRELAPQVTEELLFELMLQAGPVESVHLPRDRVTGVHSGYGFVEFRSTIDAEYAMVVMHGVPLFGRPVRVMRAGQSARVASVGARLFVGKLDASVTVQLLEQLFAPFGQLLAAPFIAAPPDAAAAAAAAEPRLAHAFVEYTSFDAADLAVQALNGHHFLGRPIKVEYAINKDANGERHGSDAERLLAKKRQQQMMW